MLIAISLLLGVSIAKAQNYGYYYYPGYSPPPTNYYQQYAGPYGYPSPLYRLHTPPRVFRKLNSYSRMLEQEALERSPLNRESSLEYLLRTF
jgi:hypothetical protein